MRHIKKYMDLMKFNLSFMVVFSCVVSFLMAPQQHLEWTPVLLLFVAGMLVAGSANAINQLTEKESDAKMKRTAKRPLVLGSISDRAAITFIIVSTLLGSGILFYFFNMSAALLSIGSLLLYAFLYTPLKKVNSLAVIVGAFPGALPCLIGWVASTNDFDLGGGTLFAIQFLWQFPHFWAIAWVVNEDYKLAGYRLLPSEQGPGRITAIQAFLFSLLLMLVCMVPYLIHMINFKGLILLLIVNLVLVLQCLRLVANPTTSAARRVMFTCYFQLLLIYFILLFTKNLAYATH